MSNKLARNSFWRGFGSVLSLMPSHRDERSKIIDLNDEAYAFLFKAWTDVGVHLKGAMSGTEEEVAERRSTKRVEGSTAEVC